MLNSVTSKSLTLIFNQIGLQKRESRIEINLLSNVKYNCQYVEIKCQQDATDDFYCRSYCLRNMFRAPLCPSSGAREYYTSGIMGCSPQTGHTTLSSTPYRQLENKVPNTTGSNHLYNTLELLMMGIMVPETC